MKMRNEIKLGKFTVGDGHPPFIIAELAANHNGNMELAKKMILEAKNAGAHCVKFQSWSKDSIFATKVYKENYFLNDNYRQRTDYDLKEIVNTFSISEKQLLEMKKYTDEVGIMMSSSPFSNREVDFLVDELDAPFIKIASMDITNYPFLEYIAKKGTPMVLSGGMCELHEFDKAIRIIEKAGNNNIIILHCISLYPPKDDQINLNNIDTFRQLYEYPVGFSDHTLGVEIPLAAVAKCASVIEKHITLDKEMFGWDHKVSATPDELKVICAGAKKIFLSLGSNRVLVSENQERKDAFRRSIVVTRDIKQGELFKRSDLDFKRPGTGLKPEFINFIIGKAAKKDLSYDDLIALEDF